jgi:hypothetical protein
VSPRTRAMCSWRHELRHSRKRRVEILAFLYIWKGMKNTIVRLNAESATSTSINLDGMEDYVKDISAIGNKVVVGTDAGVYYKSWESFLNK